MGSNFTNEINSKTIIIMKRILTLIILFNFSTLILFSQEDILPIDKETGKISYSEIVKVDSVDAKALYNNAKIWFVHYFNSAKNVLQLDDKESGRIIGKGLLNVTTSVIVKADAGVVKFTIEINAKDGRYKYTFTDFWHEAYISKITTPGDLRLSKPGGGILTMGKGNWNGIKRQTNEMVLDMILNLKKAMSSSQNKDDSW